MSSNTPRIEQLLRLRDEILAEMAEADQEYSRVRLQVERMESDLRIGRPAAPEYEVLKGKQLPAAESRVVDLFRELLKIEDKINTSPLRK